MDDKKRANLAMHQAVRANNPDGIRTAVANGADPNQLVESYPGRPTLLCAAIPELTLATVQAMVECGADINAVSESGQTPVMALTQFPIAPARNAKVLQFLIENGANLSVPNTIGYTPLDYAAANAVLRGTRDQEMTAQLKGMVAALQKAGARAGKKETTGYLRMIAAGQFLEP